MDGLRDDAPADGHGVIRIELRLDGSLPTGRDGIGRRRTWLHGWVGLMSAVDALAGNDGSNKTTLGDDAT